MPADIKHPVLGTLTFVPDLSAWESKVELDPGCTIDVRLSTRMDEEPTRNIGSLLERGVEMLQWARRNEASCRARIVDELYELYSDTWAPEGEMPVPRTEFLQRITPNALTLDINGSGFFYWADDDLFAGHWIELRFRKDWSISEVGLAG
jgi:hypothetical protein